MGTSDEIARVLQEMHTMKGRDFTFKCSLLAKKLKYPGQKISHNLSHLEQKGMIRKKGKTRKAMVYKTCFEKRDGGGSNTSDL